MKNRWNLIAAAPAILAMLACSLIQPPEAPVDEVSTIVAATLEAITLAAPAQPDSPSAPAGTAVAFPGGRLVIPPGLANGASSETVPAAVSDESMPWWGTWPEHVVVKLEGYALQGTFHKPEILIYPANEYAALNQSVAAGFQELRDQLANPDSLSGPDVPPSVPFFNAGALLGAKPEVVPFPGGQGVRALTEYAQYYAPINNNDLFYHFQGLTTDGKWFVVAILPVTSPVLAAGSGQSDVAPAGGVPFPGYDSVDESMMQNYYQAITDLLNASSPEQFHPSLASLDAMIQSLDLSSQ
jgi:hypothetical protein